jgi:hypothetical protein
MRPPVAKGPWIGPNGQVVWTVRDLLFSDERRKAYEILDRDRSRAYDSHMGKSDAERKQAERGRKADQGLKRYEFWLHPSEWPAVRKFVAGLRKRTADSGDGSKKP